MYAVDGQVPKVTLPPQPSVEEKDRSRSGESGPDAGGIRKSSPFERLSSWEGNTDQFRNTDQTSSSQMLSIIKDFVSAVKSFLAAQKAETENPGKSTTGSERTSTNGSTELSTESSLRGKTGTETGSETGSERTSQQRPPVVSGEPADVTRKGEVISVNSPIVVEGGVFDGKGATYTASSNLGDGSQSESQKPVFILKNGATLKNVDIGENGADGIHVYNGATLMNVNWQNVGEDALTVKSAGDVNIIGGSAKGAADKIFQLNADTNFHLSNFNADGFQTLVRTNGGKQIAANVTIDGGSFANGTNLFRTDSSVANVDFTSALNVENVKNKIRSGDNQIPA